jgi:MFS family permease
MKHCRKLAASIAKQPVLVLLRNRPFILLVAQQFVALVASYSVTFASMAKVVEATGSGLHAAFTVLSVVVPGLIFGLLGGVAVDRLSRRSLLIGTNLLRGLVALLAPLGMGAQEVTQLLLVVLAANFLLSVIGQFNFPAEAALVPSLVATEQLLAANSIFNVSYLAAIGIGGAIWGPVAVRILGAEWAYAIAGALFLLTLVPLGALPPDRPSRERPLRRSRYARLRHLGLVLLDVDEALRFAASSPKVTVAIVALTSQTALALSFGSLLPVVLKARFGVPTYNLPLYIAPAALGAAFAGLILISPLAGKRSRTAFVLAGNSCIATSLVGYTLTVSLPSAGLLGLAASSPLLGFGFVLAYIPGKAILQEEPPEFMRGRVISLQLTLNNLFSVFPTMLAGWALDALGPTRVFGALVLVFAVLTAWCGLWLHGRK